MILATAWDDAQELFQGIIVCIHSDVRIGGLKPQETKTRHGKIYIVPTTSLPFWPVPARLWPIEQGRARQGELGVPSPKGWGTELETGAALSIGNIVVIGQIRSPPLARWGTPHPGTRLPV